MTAYALPRDAYELLVEALGEKKKAWDGVMKTKGFSFVFIIIQYRVQYKKVTVLNDRFYGYDLCETGYFTPFHTFIVWCTGVYFVIQGVLKVNNGMRISRPLMGLMFNVFVMINVKDGVNTPSSSIC